MTDLLLVAHRAGNSLDGLAQALDAGVDLVETDVHAYRGRVEVRHLKTLGPTPWLWDRWELVHRRAWPHLELEKVLRSLGGSDRLMVDLKGVHPRLAAATAAALRVEAPGAELTVCTRHWWMLGAFSGDPHVRVVPSAGSARQARRLLARLPRRPAWGVSIHRNAVVPDLVAALRRRVAHVMTWPVNSPAALAEVEAAGVTGVISDDLGLLRQLIAQR